MLTKQHVSVHMYIVFNNYIIFFSISARMDIFTSLVFSLNPLNSALADIGGDEGIQIKQLVSEDDCWHVDIVPHSAWF